MLFNNLILKLVKYLILFNADAEEITGCRADAILKCCRREHKFNTVKGYGWKFPDDPIYEVENKCFRKVISVCPFTKKVLKEYNSIAEAAKELQVHKSSISKAILKNNKCKSRYWYYAT